MSDNDERPSLEALRERTKHMKLRVDKSVEYAKAVDEAKAALVAFMAEQAEADEGNDEWAGSGLPRKDPSTWSPFGTDWDPSRHYDKE